MVVAVALTWVEVSVDAGGWWIVAAWLSVVVLVGLPGSAVGESGLAAKWVRVARPEFHAGLPGFLLVFVLLTATFAALTAALYGSDALTAEEPIRDPVVLTLFSYYLWSFLDAIPALDIPETLNWSIPASLTDFASGAVLLTYKLLVIVPLIALVVDYVAARRSRTVLEATVWKARGLDLIGLEAEKESQGTEPYRLFNLIFREKSPRGWTEVSVRCEDFFVEFGEETRAATLGRLAAALVFKHPDGSRWNDGETAEFMPLLSPGSGSESNATIRGVRDGEELILEFRRLGVCFSVRLTPATRREWRERIGDVPAR
jgi:hypothetical protein